jgi:hypothetical protein
MIRGGCAACGFAAPVPSPSGVGVGWLGLWWGRGGVPPCQRRGPAWGLGFPCARGLWWVWCGVVCWWGLAWWGLATPSPTAYCKHSRRVPARATVILSSYFWLGRIKLGRNLEHVPKHLG